MFALYYHKKRRSTLLASMFWNTQVNVLCLKKEK
jgi:hypothetical protein